MERLYNVSDRVGITRSSEGIKATNLNLRQFTISFAFFHLLFTHRHTDTTAASIATTNMLFNAVALISTFVLALASVAVSAPERNNKVIVHTHGRFCLLLPPEAGADIAENEHRAISWCTNSMSQVPNSRIFRNGFIVSKNFYTHPDGRYTQVTGRIDRDVLGFSKHDHGGQGDPKRPNGASCVGYKYFVQLVEPDVNIYCLRCCNRKSDCPTDRSTEGCKDVIDGNYD